MLIAGIFALTFLCIGALIFVPAGRLDWTNGWVCLGVQVIGFSILTAYVARRSPTLIQRRMKVGAGTPGWDRVFVIALQLLYMATLVVGGLGVRFGWTTLPRWLQVVGLVLIVASLVLLGWAMAANPHFETTVRIQRDQQHRVIDAGPYSVVRHPGYVASILLVPGLALVLGSAWALVPAGLAALDLVARTAVEDRFLQRNLDGYRTFTERTRHRLIPHVW